MLLSKLGKPIKKETKKEMLPLLASSSSSSSECFVFRAEHNGNYLHAVYRKKAGCGRIEPTAGSVVASARTRFSVELSELHKGYVHVRCCHNNKYWAPATPAEEEDGGDTRWIIGTVNEPEDDLSEVTCTLFEPITETGKDNSIRFFHPSLGKYACVSSIGKSSFLELRHESEVEKDSSCIFSVIGLSRQKELPKHVALKGDNDKFVGTKFVARTEGRAVLAETLDFLTLDNLAEGLVNVYGIPYQQFHTTDIGDKSVILTVFTNDDGTVRIKSSNLGRFWRRNSDDWILADSDDQDCKDRDTLFEVVHGDGFIALRNLGNNKLCNAKWYDPEEKITALSACDDSRSQLARLTLAVPVVSREITVEQFQLDEARIYNSERLNLFTEHRTNGTSSEMKATFSFVQKIEIESKWETSVSSKIGVEASISAATAGGIPFIVGGDVTLWKEFATSHGDQKTEGHKQETTVAQEFTVRPRTTATVKFVAKRSCCDVPYSYKQTDVLTTGEKVTSIHDDGIYTGVNNYDFHIIISEAEYMTS